MDLSPYQLFKRNTRQAVIESSTYDHHDTMSGALLTMFGLAFLPFVVYLCCFLLSLISMVVLIVVVIKKSSATPGASDI